MIYSPCTSYSPLASTHSLLDVHVVRHSGHSSSSQSRQVVYVICPWSLVAM